MVIEEDDDKNEKLHGARKNMAIQQQMERPNQNENQKNEKYTE